MKKVLLAVVCAVLTVASSFAQQGQKAVGINLGAAPCLEDGASLTNFQLGAKFQYNVSDPVRLEAALNYGCEDNYICCLDFAVNAHYLVNLGESFAIYPLAGIGLARVKASVPVDTEYGTMDLSASKTRFMFNLGIGGEYNITDNFAANLELKYQYINDFSRLPITIGVAYKF